MASQITPAPNETLVLLARHGKTDYNEKGERIQGGNSDRPENQLNQNGKDEARRLGKMMAEMFPRITSFYSSSLGRAKETAKIVMDEYQTLLNLSLQEAKINPCFDEMRHRDHEGTLSAAWDTYARDFYEQLENKARASGVTPDRYFKWKVTPFSGGETCFELLERFNQGITEIAKENIGKTIFVASHGAAITTFTIEYETPPQEVPLRHYRDVGVRQMRNCEVAVFSFKHNAEGKDEIQFINRLSFEAV